MKKYLILGIVLVCVFFSGCWWGQMNRLLDGQISRLAIEFTQKVDPVSDFVGNVFGANVFSDTKVLPIVTKILQERGYVICDTNEAQAMLYLKIEYMGQYYPLAGIHGGERWEICKIIVNLRLRDASTQKVIIPWQSFSINRKYASVEGSNKIWHFLETVDEFLERALTESFNKRMPNIGT